MRASAILSEREAPSAREFTAPSLGLLLSAIAAAVIGPSGFIYTSFTLLMAPMSNELSWNRSTISALAASFAVSAALGSFLKGYLVDRWGARAIVLPLTCLLGFITAAVAIVPAKAEYLFPVFVAIGLLTPGNVPFAKTIAQWFSAQRGLAYAIYGVGISIGIPLGLQIGRYVIDTHGWRAAFIVFGALDLVVAAPLLLLLFKDGRASAAQAAAPPILEGRSLTQAWSSASFWLIVVNLVLGVFALAGFLTHGVAILTERGLSRGDAANVLSALSLGLVASQPLLGYLLDRFDTPLVALPFSLAAIGGVVAFQFLNGYWPLLGALAIAGLGLGGESGTTQYFIARYFGVREFSLIYGSLQPINLILAAALGPYVIGVLYDASGSYRPALQLMTAALILAAISLLLFRPYPKSADTGVSAPITGSA